MPIRTLLATAFAVAAAAAPVAAQASPGLLLGIDDDALKWYPQTVSLLSIYNQLGVGAVRVTLDYTPGETFPTGTERTELQRVGNASRYIRVVLAVTGQPSSPPLDDASRASFCGFIANVARRYPAIRDIAIWTEPNSGRFWQPQKGASAAYEALLATCWDTLHAVQSGMNVIATSAPHQKPRRWYAGLGAAYRASHRILPIFDTVGHNAYPDTSGESPSKQHTNGSFDEGDLTRLLAALTKAFAGTKQPVPGQGGVTIWYLEDGFQAAPATDRGLYTGTETDKHVVSETEQATLLTAAVQLAYCQPAVGAFFNFELRDETELDGWQSGLLHPDWTPKPAFTAYQQALAAARAGSITCAPK
ncbi:MAG TPA: hypothetical protein VFM96_04805 [Gaiellaceae bacterium]|nr:hypothetical protein [Gaiellaceae bacterium]